MSKVVELQEVVCFIDQLLNVAAESNREGNGLQVAAKETVTKIGAALNTSFESIRRASKLGVNLLLVHHTSWKKIDLHLKAKKFAQLRDSGISLYAAHEALDRASAFGTADTLASLLGMTIEDRFDNGEGVYGAFSVESFGALVDLAKAVLDGPVNSWQNTSEFRRGAIITGAGGLTTLLQQARELGCDTYVTGEGSLYTKLFAREIGINLIFGSHYGTEFPGIKAFAQRIAAEFNLSWEAISEDTAIR